jgi:hypothetical protein
MAVAFERRLQEFGQLPSAAHTGLEHGHPRFDDLVGEPFYFVRRRAMTLGVLKPGRGVAPAVAGDLRIDATRRA